MTWAARVTANKKNNSQNGSQNLSSIDQKKDDSVVFKGEAPALTGKSNLSFGSFTEQVANPVPQKSNPGIRVPQKINPGIPVAASTVLQNYPRTMSAPPKIDEQINAKINQKSSSESVEGNKNFANPSTNSNNNPGSNMGVQFVPANPYYYPQDMGMYAIGQFQYRYPMYYPPQQVLPNGQVTQNKSTSGNSALPPVAVKKSSAIKIKNPNTKEEVDLKAIMKDKPATVTATATSSAASSATVAATVAATTITTSSATAERSLSPVKPVQPVVAASVEPKVMEQPKEKFIPAPRSSAIKIVDPLKNQVVDVSEVMKKEKERAQKENGLPSVDKKPQTATLVNGVTPKPVLVTPVASASEPSKRSPGADSVYTAEDTLVSQGDSLDENSLSEDVDEEGEIPEPVVLTTNEGIKYPESLKAVIPNLSTKRYEKVFLMAFESLNLPKPFELPTMEELRGEENSFKSRGGDRRSFLSGGRRSYDYSAKDKYADNKGSGRSKKGSQRQSHRGGSSRISKAQAPVEVLVKSETAWIPHNQQKTKKNEDLVDVTSRQVKGLLNKLTVEKFETISDQIINIGIADEHILAAVISIIFEKALDEPNFGAMYAQLCLRLTQKLHLAQPWTGEGQKNMFRISLINKCQHEFQKNSKWSEADGTSSEERKARRKILESLSPEEKLKFAEEEYERAKLKRRVLGNMRFVGELFMKGLIGEKIMHSCVMQLLSSVSDPEEEDIESLCKLMTTIGAKIDHEAAKAHMETYFARITEVSNNKKLSSRIRFMLMDLIDLRKNNWKARVEVAVPKTIAEIHREAERKLAEENAEKLRMSRGGGSQKGGSARSSVSNRSMTNRSQDVRSSLSRDDQKRTHNQSKATKPILKKNSEVKEQLDVKISKNIFAALNEKETNDLESPVLEVSAAPSTPKMTKDQAKNKIDAMIAEWWCNFDVKEIKLTLEELGESSYYQVVIDSFLNASMERKIRDVEKTVELFSKLFNDSIFTSDGIIKGCADQIEFAEDNLPDAPQLFKHLAMFLGRFILDGVLALSALPKLFKPLIASRSRKPPAPKLLGEVLASFRDSGDDVLIDVFQADPIDLEIFWPEDQRSEDVRNDWMNVYGLNALKPGGNDDLEQEFSGFLGTHEDLEKWIDEHSTISQSPGFSFQLSSVVLNNVASQTFYPSGSSKAAKITTDTYINMRGILSSFMPILTKYLTTNAAKLSFLEAVVNCWENVGQPEELLESLFRLVWELELVGVEIFEAYKAAPKSSEASKRLVGWFKYLEHQK